jgi:hypothetical protein
MALSKKGLHSYLKVSQDLIQRVFDLLHHQPPNMTSMSSTPMVYFIFSLSFELIFDLMRLFFSDRRNIQEIVFTSYITMWHQFNDLFRVSCIRSWTFQGIHSKTRSRMVDLPILVSP